MKYFVQGAFIVTRQPLLVLLRWQSACVVWRMLKGMIIIGVEDSKHIIVGVPDDRVALTIDTILRAARQNVKPALVLDPPEPELYELSGKRLVVASVPLSRGPGYQSGGVFWVRRGTHTVP